MTALRVTGHLPSQAIFMLATELTKQNLYFLDQINAEGRLLLWYFTNLIHATGRRTSYPNPSLGDKE